MKTHFEFPSTSILPSSRLQVQVSRFLQRRLRVKDILASLDLFVAIFYLEGELSNCDENHDRRALEFAV